ncbi:MULTISPECIES: DNA polymerase III subunit delta' [unclassified Nitratiruptor]|uniref:DNA polymerase III subunit delta' n=1 Tax=unclassified Nitratiruptor TaxID=2624044 RepID=UPI00191541AD|nr:MULTISPECIES: DNA polymerase III subunit delta' [unclassified Nitratiruptor]BCD60139.1 DNA polymerase III subunit delta' [Nitratiruptor sp. YY08-10]BCD64372.1 DNA polymerase III subunit delta' [Nitratiruptor sp. YY08-14]
MIDGHSKIIICEDFEPVKLQFQEKLESENLAIFEENEIKLELAKEAIKEAFIATKEEKYIVLLGNRFNIYAQNALLKVLEEPPNNVYFILVSKAKSTFLPTILSRLPVVKIKGESTEPIDLETFDLEILYDLVKRKDITKAEAKALIKSMLKFALKNGYSLSQREMDYFSNALHLIELNTNISNVLITAGLIVLTHKKRRR